MELKDNILVSGNADSTVKIWDIKTGQCLQTLQGESTIPAGKLYPLLYMYNFKFNICHFQMVPEE